MNRPAREGKVEESQRGEMEEGETASTREEGKGKESQQVESTVRRVKRIIIIPGGRIDPHEKEE